MLVQCWPAVYGVGPTLCVSWDDASCNFFVAGYPQEIAGCAAPQNDVLKTSPLCIGNIINFSSRSAERGMYADYATPPPINSSLCCPHYTPCVEHVTAVYWQYYLVLHGQLNGRCMQTTLRRLL